MWKQTAVATAALALAAGAATARIELRSDHQKGVDFAAYATWSPAGGTPAAIVEVQEWIEGAVEAGLRSSALEPADAADADLLLRIHAPLASQEAVDVDAFDYGARDWPGWETWGPTTVNVRTIRPGSIVIDLLDAATGELVWRGIADEALEGKVGKLEKKIAKAVESLLRRYPE